MAAHLHDGAAAPGGSASDQGLKGRSPADRADRAGLQGGVAERNEQTRADCADLDDQAQTTAERKLIDTLRARLALAGVELHELANGAGFLILGRGLLVRCCDVHAVRAWVRGAGL